MDTTTSRRKKPAEASIPSLPQSAINRGKVIAARYQIKLWRQDGEWYGEGIEEPGAMGDGRTIAQCVRNVRYALALAVASHIVYHEPITTPLVDQERRRRKAG
ncbi:MAG TPA: hypothetical protein VFC78_01975 [Tepidisphaeraceae bacterium]|nr:hypothetical protein [Tepidisphaeraceae bacterium]